MNRLLKLQKKKKKLVIGLMSGTSADGIDAALVEIEGSSFKTKFKELYFNTYPYPKGLKEFIFKNSLKEESNVEDICCLNFLIGKLFAKAAINVCKDYGISIDKVDLIGSHGQTIHHLPNEKRLFGEKIRATLQIGDPSVIAKLTGVPTVGDFRVGDIALEGQGAPLVPYFDFLVFRSSRVNRALLNIGGISNVTLLKKNCSIDDVIAFDTGPGNMLIDYLVKKFFRKKFDRNGEIAKKGKVDNKLLKKIFYYDSFAKQKPPKSTGREFYNEKFINLILSRINGIRKIDIITTFTEYTAFVNFYNLQKFILPESNIKELIVSGGGANNEYLMQSLKNYFGPDIIVKKVESNLLSANSKEAVCFAILANETISEHPTNLPRVTGANSKTILGKICL